MNDDRLVCQCGAQTIRKPDAFISPFEIISWLSEDEVIVRCQLCKTDMLVHKIPAMR